MSTETVAPAADTTTAAESKPTVTGPITGGTHGHPFGAYVGDISTRGYIEHEYFLEGQAVRYRPVGELSPDGRWSVEPLAASPYKTRILVRRPRDPSKFNGAVLVEWTNVSAGFEITVGDSPGVYDGFAYVAVSAQYVGVHGFETNPMGLAQWDSERYGALSIPGDSLSYDIYSQAARALRDRSAHAGVDPLGGLRVETLIAIGGSQSAGRLITYTNAVQPRDRLFDAIMPLVGSGSGSGFDDATVDPRKLATMSADDLRQIRRAQTRIRDDLAIPVMFVNSECETLPYLPSRQPDTDRFRMWEVAGASHGPKGQMDSISAKLSRDFGPAGSLPMPGLPSTVEWTPVADAAIAHVNRWINGGAPPPRQPPIQIEDGKVARDPFGNAKGGIRLPDVEVPTAAYDGGGFGVGTTGLGGQTTPFSADQLKRLYPTHDDYVAKVVAAARSAGAEGVILAGRVESYIEDARRAAIP
jgi:hypothetical protein